MKKVIRVFVLAVFALAGCSAPGGGKGPLMNAQPILEVAGPVKMDNKAVTTVSGRNFKPGQEINLVFTTSDGLQNDVGYALEPTPKADGSGAWSTTWKVGDFIAKKKVKAGGSHELTATDSDYNPLAKTTLTFIK